MLGPAGIARLAARRTCAISIRADCCMLPGCRLNAVGDLTLECGTRASARACARLRPWSSPFVSCVPLGVRRRRCGSTEKLRRAWRSIRP